MSIKVAIPIWDGRISPVMDTAGRLLVVEIVDSEEVSRTTVDIPLADVYHRANVISGFGIDILICGAISRQFDQMLTTLGIKTNPWFRGNVNEVIDAYLKGVLQNDNFLLPGCGRRRGRQRGRRCGQLTRFNSRTLFKEE